MKRNAIIVFLAIMALVFGGLTASASAKEYKGIATDGLNFSKEVRLDIEGNSAKVTIGPYTINCNVEDTKAFMANPTGRVGANMKFTYIPENDQYKVTFLISGTTNGTSNSSFAEGILSPQK